MHLNPQFKSNILPTSISSFESISRNSKQLKWIFSDLYVFFQTFIIALFLFLYCTKVRAFASAPRFLTGILAQPDDLAARYIQALKGQWVGICEWDTLAYGLSSQCLHPLRRWATSCYCTLYLLISFVVYFLGSIYSINQCLHPLRSLFLRPKSLAS